MAPAAPREAPIPPEGWRCKRFEEVCDAVRSLAVLHEGRPAFRALETIVAIVLKVADIDEPIALGAPHRLDGDVYLLDDTGTAIVVL